MEAKDTILNPKQISVVEDKFPYGDCAKHYVVDALLLAQAEASFKEGRKVGVMEVVEWINYFLKEKGIE